MVEILTVIAPLFLIIFASALLQKLKNIGDDWSQVLNDFALKIGLPVLVFSALSKASFSFYEQSGLILANTLFILGSFFLALVFGKIFRLKKPMAKTLFICLSFGNVAYLGIPVLEQIYGESVLPTASLIVAVYLFWMFTVGLGFLDYGLEKKKRTALINILKNLIKNPLLIAVVLGIAMATLNLTLPGIVLKSLDMITASVTPTVLIVIGLFIGKSKIGKVKDWVPVFFFSLATLVVLPAIFYFGVQLFGYTPSDFSATIIQAGMPLAITPFALADKFQLHKEFIARSIVLSTVLSVVSLPFLISLLT